MKKKYLTLAGIISALILAGMFIGICLSPVPAPLLPPGTTFDPITDTSIDDNNMLVVTGTTTLQSEYTLFELRITDDSPSLSQETAPDPRGLRGNAWLNSQPGGRNRWKGFVNISPLLPGDYTVSLVTISVTNQSTLVFSDPIATQHFTLHDERAGAGTIRKKTRTVQPFIRINGPDQGPATTTGEITGITNLAPGSPLAWTIQVMANESGPSPRDTRGTTYVIRGTAEINRWTVIPGNATAEPSRYLFHITGIPGNATSPLGTISASAELSLPQLSGARQNATGTPQMPPTFITIDALPEIRTNGMYTVSGTTSVPAGEGLIVTVKPPSFDTDYNVSFDPQEKDRIAEFAGAVAMADVVNGSSGYNLWSCTFATYNLYQGRWEVNVSRDIIDPVTHDLAPGTLFTAKKFTIGS